MQQPGGVNGLQPFGEQGAQTCDQRCGQRAVDLDLREQRAAGNVLHREPRLVCIWIGVQKPGYPVRPDHRACDEGFLLEPSARDRV